MPSPIGYAPEVPCARCRTPVAGLAWGARCPACQQERRRRARRLARRLALLAALVAGALLSWRVPAPWSEESRVWIGIGALGTFLLVRLIAIRIAMEFLPD